VKNAWNRASIDPEQSIARYKILSKLEWAKVEAHSQRRRVKVLPDAAIVVVTGLPETSGPARIASL
jgi:hypothetical protein